MTALANHAETNSWRVMLVEGGWGWSGDLAAGLTRVEEGEDLGKYWLNLGEGECRPFF